MANLITTAKACEYLGVTSPRHARRLLKPIGKSIVVVNATCFMYPEAMVKEIARERKKAMKGRRRAPKKMVSDLLEKK